MNREIPGREGVSRLFSAETNEGSESRLIEAGGQRPVSPAPPRAEDRSATIQAEAEAKRLAREVQPTLQREAPLSPTVPAKAESSRGFFSSLGERVKSWFQKPKSRLNQDERHAVVGEAMSNFYENIGIRREPKSKNRPETPLSGGSKWWENRGRGEYTLNESKRVEAVMAKDPEVQRLKKILADNPDMLANNRRRLEERLLQRQRQIAGRLEERDEQLRRAA